MSKILILLVVFGAQQIFAQKYAPLDNCVHYTGPNYPYKDFIPLKNVKGKVSFSFHIISPGTPCIQINAEKKLTTDFYEIVFDGKSELRRRRTGKSYIVLHSASRSDLLSTYKPFAVRIETVLVGLRRRVDVFINNEKKAFLSGLDTETAIDPNYYSFVSFQKTSQFWHKCTKPRPQDCSIYVGIISILRADISRLTAILANILFKSGLTLAQISKIIGGTVRNGQLIDGVGNIVILVGNLIGGVVHDVGTFVSGLLG